MSNQPVTVSQAIEAWLDYPDNTQLAKSTLDSKRRTLKALQKAAGSPDYLVEFLTLQHFADTMHDLAEGGSQDENAQRRRKGLKPRTGRSTGSLELDRSALTMFAEYLRVQGWVAPTFYPLHRFTSSSKVDEAEATPKRGVADADFVRLLDAAGAHHARSRIEVAVGLFFGRRVSELVGKNRDGSTAAVQWKHVNLTDSTMSYLNVKRGRWVDAKPFMGPLKVELGLWRDWMVERFGPIDPDWYLIPAKWHMNRLCLYKDIKFEAMYDPSRWPVEPNKPATAESITADIKRALRAVGWPEVKGEGMHTLRRTHLRKWDEAGDLAGAQEAADHSLRSTTEHYTGNLSAKRRHAAKVVDQDPFGVLPEVTQESELATVIDLAGWRKRAG